MACPNRLHPSMPCEAHRHSLADSLAGWLNSGVCRDVDQDELRLDIRSYLDHDAKKRGLLPMAGTPCACASGVLPSDKGGNDA